MHTHMHAPTHTHPHTYAHTHRINLESSEFANHLRPFLHDNTSHFMHELISFAKSPYDMVAYDNKVKYDWPEDHPIRESGGWDEDTTTQPGRFLVQILFPFE